MRLNRLRLSAVAGGLVLLGCVTGRAVADDAGFTSGSTVCGRGSCDLSAYKTTSGPGLDHSGPGTAAAPGASGGTPACVSRPSSDVMTLPSGSRGQWYLIDCGSGTLAGANLVGMPSGVPLWSDLGDANQPTPAVDPRVLAQQAVSSLRLPKPQVHLNPGTAGPQVVRVPTWLWVEPGQWQPVRATAELPGVSVVAIATPLSAEWDMGDGARVVCRGAGTPYDRRFEAASSSPDCGHTYLRSSRREADGVFPVSVTVHWSVSWSGGGQGGTFPGMTTSLSLPVRVVEVQSLVTG